MYQSLSKAILLGEHAVVYGQPALAFGFGQGATAVASRADSATIRVGPLDNHQLHLDGLRRLLNELNVAPCAVQVDLQVAPGIGLGASAAIAVAASRAVLAHAGIHEPTPEEVWKGAMHWETLAHGTASGVDVWACATDVCFRFVREPSAPLPSVTVVPSGVDLHLAIALAGSAESTASTVGALKEKRGTARFQSCVQEIGQVTETALHCIKSGDLTGLGQQLDRNHELLAKLELSTPDIERACAIAKQAKALGAKLTGKGRGGCVLALALSSDAAHAILCAWRNAGLHTCFSTVIRAAQA
jgi:mevalonate kinase